MDRAYGGFLSARLLWHGMRFGLHQFVLPAFDLEVSSLPMVPRNRRLGHQAEFVFGQLIKASKRYSVIADSIQLTGQTRTLGELDYIIHDLELEQFLHVELTYKFYLLDKSISERLEQLVGPNRSDNFVKKLTKIKDKQLPLLYSDASREVLKKYAIDPDEIEQRVAFYGHVFTPIDDVSFDIEGLDPHCVAGVWVCSDDFDATRFGNSTFYLPSKSEWLHLPHRDQEWIKYKDVRLLIEPALDKNRSSMLWVRSADDVITKLFVTFE